MLPPTTRRAGLLRDRHRLTGDEGLVDRAPALDHGTVDRHLLAGTHAQAVADRDVLEPNLLVGPVGLEPARGLRRQVEERPQRAAGALARPKLQHLPEEDEHRDDGRGLEVGRARPRHGLAGLPGTGRA